MTPRLTNDQVHRYILQMTTGSRVGKILRVCYSDNTVDWIEAVVLPADVAGLAAWRTYRRTHPVVDGRLWQVTPEDTHEDAV
jgi:hypothetical protein